MKHILALIVQSDDIGLEEIKDLLQHPDLMQVALLELSNPQDWWHTLEKGNIIQAKDPLGCQVSYVYNGAKWKIAPWELTVEKVDIPQRRIIVTPDYVFNGGLFVSPDDIRFIRKA